MQNTQEKIYAEVVGAAIASYAEAITHAAQDSVAEQNDYLESVPVVFSPRKQKVISTGG